MKTKEDLEAEAAILYPYPLKRCAYIIMRINWLREKWVSNQLKNEL